MILGVDYYPEQWPESRWATDARRMRELGLEVVRLAEFAWAKMEPTEGQFDWTWLDRAIETLAATGLRIVLGTPTAAPPPWLSRRYPDTLPVDDQGRRSNVGGRRHYCANSPTYRECTRRIVEAMARRYARHPSLIGWQIDNEWGEGKTARCYCPNCAAAFRAWLQQRYGSLAALNEAWGNVFWSQTYTDWSQIEPPILTWAGSPNPSHTLDYYRFSSDSWLDYQQLQCDILKAASNSHDRPFITTNFMGIFPNLDHYKLAAPLDFVTWDSYPTGYAERYGSLLYLPGQLCGTAAYDVGDPYVTGFCHDLMRGLKEGAPFWVMEQQAGHINWGEINPAIRAGTVRLWTWHNLAAGADATVYFRWRAGLFAQEQYHSGLLRHDAAPDLGYREVLRMKDEQPVMRSLQGTRVLAEVAILADYDDLWALDLQPHNRLINYWRYLFAYHRALARAGVPTDVVSTHADLGRYRLAVAPCLLLADETLAARLTEYVRAGGTLLLGARSGFKTRTNLVTDQPLPGPFRDLVGATVETWHSLPPGITYPLADLQSQALEAITWAEGLSAQSAQPLMSYTGGPLEGLAAVTVNAVGQGRVLYAGLWPSETVVGSLISWILPRASVQPMALVPEGVLVSRRGDFVFLLNFTDVPVTARLYLAGASDSFTGQAVEREVTIPPRDVRVLRQTSNTSKKRSEQ